MKAQRQDTTLDDFSSDSEDNEDEWGMFKHFKKFRCTGCGELHEFDRLLVPTQVGHKVTCCPGNRFEGVGDGEVPPK